MDENLVCIEKTRPSRSRFYKKIETRPKKGSSLVPNCTQYMEWVANLYDSLAFL